MVNTLNDTVYNELKSRILEGVYKPNEVISERSIAAEFNVSKTPVREALVRLCQEGDITRYAGMGYVITDLSYADAVQIAEVRCIVECAVADIIIKYVDDEEIRRLYEIIDSDEKSEQRGCGKNTTFHYEMAKLTRNSHLAETVRSLAMSTMRPSTWDKDKGPVDEDMQHRQIVDNLLKRDAETAKRHLKDNIRIIGQREL